MGENMKEAEETKPRSFRVSSITYDRFKEISKDIDGNQDIVLARLIEAFEIQAAKEVYKDNKAEIEQFEKYMNALNRMFMGKVEENNNMADTTRAMFEGQLSSKDKIINDLQTRLDAAQKECEEAKDSALTLKREANTLSTKIHDLQVSFIDKENLIDILKDTNEEQKAKLENMKGKCAEASTIIEERDNLKQALDQANKDIAALNAAKSHAEEAAALDCERRVLELRDKYHQELEEVRRKNQNEIYQYQVEFFKLVKGQNPEQEEGQIRRIDETSSENTNQ